MAPSTAKPVADPVRTDRYERKFAIAGIGVAEVEHAIRLHPAQFSEIYQERFINNCYFDSPFHHLYRDAIEGHPSRLKVRIRWYGDLFGAAAKPRLELKRKEGLVGTKESFPVPGFVLDRGSDLGVLVEWFSEAEIPPEISGVIGAFRPTLVNRYRRRYFGSADRRLRMTLDTGCEYYQPEPPHDQATSLAGDVSAIVELKYQVADDSLAAAAANHFPARITKSSKYVNGLSLVRRR